MLLDPAPKFSLREEVWIIYRFENNILSGPVEGIIQEIHITPYGYNYQLLLYIVPASMPSLNKIRQIFREDDIYKTKKECIVDIIEYYKRLI